MNPRSLPAVRAVSRPASHAQAPTRSPGRRARTLAFSALLAGLALLPAAAPRAAGVVELGAGIHLISAEVARTHDERMLGLMRREYLAPNHGMLFIFDEAAPQCMWMRNTPLALSVAFLDDDGTVVNVEEMRPRTDDTHCAGHPVRFALEMSAGWFERHGVHAGERLRGLPQR